MRIRVRIEQAVIMHVPKETTNRTGTFDFPASIYLNLTSQDMEIFFDMEERNITEIALRSRDQSALSLAED
jgi:hypothetical protein